MFERYTEKARRSIFFARWEASQFGSPYIEPEHLLLGLMRHTTIIGEIGAAVRAEIEQSLPRGTKTSTSADLPLSLSAKRVLAYASEESERANSQHIGVEHMLLGLLRESHSIAGLLQRHGIDRATILADSPQETMEPVPERAILRALVDALPEGALPDAKRALERMHYWPPVASTMQAAVQREIEIALAAAGHSSRRVEDGVEIYETRYFRDGHEIRCIERIRLSDDGKTLSYTQEVSGPGQSMQHTIDFDVSGS